jgi:predicted metal-dependent HD superfamily phosphohydrolase
VDQPSAEIYILSKLRHGLPRERTYHNFSHTLDVYRSAVALAMQNDIEGVELDLLRTAALYHDSGFLKDDHEHEEAGCQLAREALPQFGYTPELIDRVCGLIMATKIPQRPGDLLGQILCDADLDYLGRSDFFRIGTTLYWEFRHYGIVKNERDWNELQVRFMTSHVYFTATSRAEREPLKQRHLQKVKEWLANNP